MAQSRFGIKTFGSVSVFDYGTRWNNIPFYSVGDLKHSAINSDHNGWLICDGRSLARVKYSDLFDVIGTAYGSSDSTHFNVPNTQSRVLGCVGQGPALTNRTMGTVIGEETHTMTTNELVSHTHTGTSDAAGYHTHTSNSSSGSGNYGLIQQSVSGASVTTAGTDAGNSGTEPNVSDSPVALAINYAAAHQHTFTTASTGTTSAFNVMQPTIFIGNVFIFSNHIQQL